MNLSLSFYSSILDPLRLLSYFSWLISIVRRSARVTLSSNDHDFFNGTWFLPDDISYTISAREPESFFSFFIFFFLRLTIRSHDVYLRMYAYNKYAFKGCSFDFNYGDSSLDTWVNESKFFFSFFTAWKDLQNNFARLYLMKGLEHDRLLIRCFKKQSLYFFDKDVIPCNYRNLGVENLMDKGASYVNRFDSRVIGDTISRNRSQRHRWLEKGSLRTQGPGG